MKTLFSPILLFLVPVMLSAQNNFTVEGYGDKIRDGDRFYLSYKYGGKYILDSTVAGNKRFYFSGVVNEPVKARIDRNENPEYTQVLTQYLTIYLEPGIIRITSPDTLSGARISGTGLNDTLQWLHSRLSGIEKRRRSIKDPDLFTDAEKKDTLLMNRNNKALNAIFFEMVDKELEFAREYPSSWISLEIVADRSRINNYIDKIEQVYNLFPLRLQQTPQGMLIAERIKKKRQVAVGMKAPAFVMNTSQGKAFEFTTGKYTLLDFWASWCLPCREEHPNLIALYEKYKGKGFTIVSISIDTGKERWLQAVTRDQLTWPQLSDLKGDKGETYLKYGITSIPANFLIDPQGIVIAKDLKGEALQEKLAAIFAD